MSRDEADSLAACLVLALFALIVNMAPPSPPPAPADVEAPSAHCGCPAPAGECTVPCSACCNDPATPENEECPCTSPPASSR